jgi:hypothetical protein
VGIVVLCVNAIRFFFRKESEEEEPFTLYFRQMDEMGFFPIFYWNPIGIPEEELNSLEYELFALTDRVIQEGANALLVSIRPTKVFSFLFSFVRSSFVSLPNTMQMSSSSVLFSCISVKGNRQEYHKPKDCLALQYKSGFKSTQDEQADLACETLTRLDCRICRKTGEVEG